MREPEYSTRSRDDPRVAAPARRMPAAQCRGKVSQIDEIYAACSYGIGMTPS